jgi:hypothetical protein
MYLKMRSSSYLMIMIRRIRIAARVRLAFRQSCNSSAAGLVSAMAATVTSSFRDADFVAVVFASRDELGRAVSLWDDSV